ncbi:MAG: transposase, partial [Firmicutes bacterium]|nr:transposase [Bacillota bacterium]
MSAVGTATNYTQEVVMISVGIDVSKGKSTACAVKPYGEIIASPFEFQHTDSDLKSVVEMFSRLDEDVKVVMEATSIYHLPVATYLKEHGVFVS